MSLASLWTRIKAVAVTLFQPDSITAAKLVAASIDKNTAALDRLHVTLNSIGKQMSQSVQDFSATVNAAFDKISAATDGLAADVTALKDEIAKLQASEGQITADDQALLDSIQTRAQAVGDKLAALDALTEQAPTPTADTPQ